MLTDRFIALFFLVTFFLLLNNLLAQPNKTKDKPIPLEQRVPNLKNQDVISGGVRNLDQKESSDAKRRRETYLEIDLEFDDEIKDIEKAKEIEKEKREFRRFIIDYELGFYYSNTFIMYNLTEKPVPEAGEKNELSVYSELFFSSHLPRFVLLEASVNPMPLAGVGLREGTPELYNRANAGKNLNLIQAITAGFEEPYAVSFFMGNVMQFSRTGRELEEGNLGYMGWLLSYGTHHILDNYLVEDHWFEIEWKVKGDRNFPDHILSWSFRFGGKIHLNEEITDVMYVAARRSLADFTTSGFSLFRNTGIEYRMDFDPLDAAVIRHYFTVDKKVPFIIGERFEGKKLVPRRFAFVLALGFIWEANQKYSGSLKALRGEKPNWQFVIRPNVEF